MRSAIISWLFRRLIKSGDVEFEIGDDVHVIAGPTKIKIKENGK